MAINSKKLWLYLKDAGLINEIESKLKCYIYFVDYIGEFMPYINGVGMDFDTKYEYEVEIYTKYNDKAIHYSHETKTFSDDAGHTPNKYSRGDLICSYNTKLDDINLNDYSRDKLEEIIIKEYGITNEIIDNFYGNNENKISTETNIDDDELIKLYKEIDEIDFQINNKKSTIESLKKAIDYLEAEKSNRLFKISKNKNK